MSDNIKHTWGWLSWHRTDWGLAEYPSTGKHNAYAMTFVDENYTEPGLAWQQIEINCWARHPIKAMKAVCITPRSADELMALNGAILD